eukprot:TRINITY_DN14445_c0_g2_i1.p1 TRINITY_DN14445_c0_g2~~TRINITY_DN14445_c0_g2_i1.p1  ORF type:complete len:430 (-),score=78.41 TRINITY_DN14445_c0_g2_i1:147-1436(-)
MRSTEELPADDAVVDGRRPLLQLAPMMEVTYKDFRQFMRILTKKMQMWTEMWVDNTVCHSEKVDEYLDFGKNEHPIVCQLGGSNPETLARAAKVIAERGYDEINLNCGCPSDRVAGKGEFGASLMKRPELVRDCVRSIADAVQIPVTVKCRLGVDDLDSPEFTANFVRIVSQGGVKHFIIHARKCILKGLTPDQNRKIPPLMYDRVYLLCQEFPDLHFSLNGGVNTLVEARAVLDAAPPNLLGVMIGRAALANPCMLWDTDSYIYGLPRPVEAPTRHAILTAYCEYLESEYGAGDSAAMYERSGPCLGALKPVIGVFAGVTGNKLFRQSVERLAHDKELRRNGPGAVLRRCLEVMAADPKAEPRLFEPLPAAGTVVQESGAPSAGSSGDGAATPAASLSPTCIVDAGNGADGAPIAEAAVACADPIPCR